MISTRPNPFFALPPTLFFLQLVAAQVELAADLQKEVDANRPTCDALLEDAYDTFTESGQSGLAKKLYSDYLTSPSGVFVWCSDVTDPDGEDMVMVASPLLTPGTTLEELMTNDDNTDEQRQLVYDVWDAHHLNSTARCCGPEKRFDWYGYFDQEESNDGTVDATEGTRVPNVAHTALMVSERIICTCTMTGVPPSRNNTIATIVHGQLTEAAQSGGAGLGIGGLVMAGVVATLLL